MASLKSDPHSETRARSLTHDRPGLYVQVVSPRRRKSQAPAPVELVEAHPTVVPDQERAAAITVAGETVRTEWVPEDEPFAPSLQDGAAHSFRTTEGSVRPQEHEYGRPDLVVVSLPAPPRLPSISLSGAPLSASPRDARLSTAASPKPAKPPTIRARSWGQIAAVALPSTIIAAALVVFLREEPSPTAEPSSSLAPPPAKLANVQTAPAAPVLKPRADQPVVQALSEVPTPEVRVAPASGTANGQASSPRKTVTSAPAHVAKPAEATLQVAAAARASAGLVVRKSGLEQTPDGARAPEDNADPSAASKIGAGVVTEPVLGAQRALPGNPYEN